MLSIAVMFDFLCFLFLGFSVIVPTKCVRLHFNSFNELCLIINYEVKGTGSRHKSCKA